jgi:hypothetical protein
VRATIYGGDCRDSMLGLAPSSVDAIVTDPPYGLEFMGRGWDYGVPGRSFFSAMLEVARPGAHLVAFGGTRLFHRQACAIEEAGWELRDMGMWLYGSGFPKAADVSKMVDKRAGAEREVVGTNPNVPTSQRSSSVNFEVNSGSADITIAATPLARAFDGYKSALKPAWEPIIIAMKPLDGTLATNAERHGCAGFNVDGCRVGDSGATRRAGKTGAPSMGGAFTTGHRVEQVDAGRYPANLILDPDFAEHLDAVASTGDGPSRFFYSAKASKSDRRYIDPDTGEERFSDHPTVKPQSLMRWLTKLVLPPDRSTLPEVHPLHGQPRVVLDPFLGSGSTGVACVAEGVEHFIGCERVEHFQRISEARLKDAGADTKVVPG